MVDINIKAVNLAKWTQAGVEISKAINGRQMMIGSSKVLKARFERLSKEAFETEGFSTGKLWKPLSRGYAFIKQRNFPTKTILRRKDALFKSYTKKPISLSFRSSSGYTYVYGSNDKKAKWHQKGTDKMPAREVIQYTPQQLLGITASIRRTMYDVILKRKFFDRVPSIRLAIHNSGFDRVKLP